MRLKYPLLRLIASSFKTLLPTASEPLLENKTGVRIGFGITYGFRPPTPISVLKICAFMMLRLSMDAPVTSAS